MERVTIAFKPEVWPGYSNKVEEFATAAENNIGPDGKITIDTDHFAERLGDSTYRVHTTLNGSETTHTVSSTGAEETKRLVIGELSQQAAARFITARYLRNALGSITSLMQVPDDAAKITSIEAMPELVA